MKEPINKLKKITFENILSYSVNGFTCENGT